MALHVTSTSEALRWRKVTDVGRAHASFELLRGEETILDVGFSDDAEFEIASSTAIGGMVLSFATLQALLLEGRALAEADL